MKFAKYFLATSAMLAGQQAFAQDTVSESEEGGDIVVTGQYIVEDRIDTATGLGLTTRETPQSVSIITEQRILDQNLVSAADVLVNSVGVSVNKLDDIRNQFYARGFEIKNIQVDGVPLAWTLAGGAGETNIDVSVYERVEVVRGATGLLTGVGDPSASVNFVRKHADSKELTGYVNASYGSWNTWRATADVAGALTADGRIRFRAVGRYEEGESQVDLYENQKFVLYGVIDADITDSTLLRAGIIHQEGKPDAPAWGNLPTFYSDGTETDWEISKAATADWTYWNTVNQNIFATLQQQVGDDWSVTVNYNRLKNREEAKLLYLSGTVNPVTGLLENSFFPVYPYKDQGESVQNSVDAQVKGEVALFGRKHEVVLGALHSVQERYTDAFAALSFPASPDYINWDGSTYPDPGFSDTASRAVEQTVRQDGVYGALRLNLTDGFKVIGGGRYAHWEQEGFDYSGASKYGDDAFIPYIGALLDLNSNHRLYASFTKIFTPQGAQDVNFVQLDPITGKSYEIGLKSAFFNERLQTSISLFRIEQDNLAVLVGTATPPGGLPQNVYRPADDTVSQGFEIEVAGELAPGLNVNFGFSHFTIKDENDLEIVTEQPRNLAKFFMTYRLPGALSGLTVGGGANYRSKAYTPGQNPITLQPYNYGQDGYALVSLMARYDVTDAFQIQANVENLFDTKYYAQVGFYDQYRYGAERNFTIGASYRF